MKICAIIAEYNPFHNGHKYQIQMAKQQTNCDAILVLMSGNFVQRGEGAIFNKYLRAKAALNNGADFVFELPTVIATSCSQIFAEGAINILNKFNDVKYLCFGCEDNNLDTLKNIAKIQLHESVYFKKTLKQNLQEGLSYASSYNNATHNTSECEQKAHTMRDITNNKPNNLLGIEYIKALIKTNSKIEPIAIQRIGSDYNSVSADCEFISASGARKLFEENNIKELEKFIPENILDEFCYEYEKHKINIKMFEMLIINALRNCNINSLFDSSDFLNNKLKNNSFKFLTLNEIILNTKSKCFSYSRIRRLCLQALLEITKELGKNFTYCTTRLLGIKENYKNYIANFPTIVNIKNKDINSLEGVKKILSDIDKRASNIYSLLTNKTGNEFFNTKLLIT